MITPDKAARSQVTPGGPGPCDFVDTCRRKLIARCFVFDCHHGLSSVSIPPHDRCMRSTALISPDMQSLSATNAAHAWRVILKAQGLQSPAASLGTERETLVLTASITGISCLHQPPSGRRSFTTLGIRRRGQLAALLCHCLCDHDAMLLTPPPLVGVGAWSFLHT